MKILHDNVLIKPVEKTTASGLVLTESKEGLLQGEVVDVGEGTYRDGVFINTTLKKGQIVMYGKTKFAPYMDVTINGENYLLMPEGSVHVILD